MLFEKVPTPCVGICSTTYGDYVCRGCRRYLHEVVNWNRFSDAQKRLIWGRLDALQAQILPQYFALDDIALLRQQMEALRLPLRPEASPWCWLYGLLKAGVRQEDLAAFGVTRLDLRPLSLSALREQINGELHQLAAAYYEKDFLRAQQNVSSTD